MSSFDVSSDQWREYEILRNLKDEDKSVVMLCYLKKVVIGTLESV